MARLLLHGRITLMFYRLAAPIRLRNASQLAAAKDLTGTKKRPICKTLHWPAIQFRIDYTIPLLTSKAFKKAWLPTLLQDHFVLKTAGDLRKYDGTEERSLTELLFYGILSPGDGFGLQTHPRAQNKRVRTLR